VLVRVFGHATRPPSAKSF